MKTLHVQNAHRQMYVTMLCERADAYAGSYNPVPRRKSKKADGGPLIQSSMLLGAGEISNDSRTTNHEGFLTSCPQK
jgi:hypothetical protein